MSVINTLITDRTFDDASRVFELREKILTNGVSSLTEEEYDEYFGGMKGAYNATDLNRVGEACAYLYNMFVSNGFALAGFKTPKTDWQMDDIPTMSQIETYVGNVNIIRKAIAYRIATPSAMNFGRLSTEDANNIERILVKAEETIWNIMKAFMFSGEFEAGEV